ncbi:scabin-related ADP-ribosyltransferase [Acidiphilium sp. MT5]
MLPNDQKLWRIDGRGTDDIFENGFNARGEDTDIQNYVNTNSPSIFIGTSTNPNILQNPDFGLPGKYFYQIDGSGLEIVNINQVYPTNPFSDEEEMAIIGKIPIESIVGAQQILPNGDLGSFIMNPNYGGNP